MRGHLIQIDAIDAAGESLTLRLASVPDSALCHLDGQQWWANIARLPTLRYDFFGGTFQGQISAPQAQFSVSLDGITPGRLYADARVRVWTGTIGDAFGSFTLRFDGRLSGEPEVRAGIASFTAAPDDAWLDTPLLDTFAGSGGVEGPDDLTGSDKLLALGHVEWADHRLIDPVNLIYLVNDGAISGVSAVYDRAQALGATVGNSSDLANLIAASIPAGRFGTCTSLGLVRLGAPPDGKVAFDVSGDNRGSSYARLPGALIGRVVSIAGGTANAANLTALDSARPCNLQINVVSQTTARQLIQQIADSVGAVAGISWTGELFVQPLAIDATPAITLNTDGTSELPVASVSALAMGAPFWRLATEAERTWVVYDQGEVATQYVIRGAYDAAKTYRLDDLVFIADGSSWVYNNAVPSAGNAPPASPATSDAYWLQVGARIQSPRGTYSAGTTYGVGDSVAWLVADGGDGNSYIRIGTGSTTGTSPSDATKWALLVVGGSGGSPGLSVARPLIYKRAASTPSLPTATTTFTFSTGALTGLDNGWTREIPAADGNPLYVSGASAASSGTTDTIAAGEWASPVIMLGSGTAGTDGLNQATVTIYRRAASTPTLPSASTTYTFATGALTGLNNSWTRAIPTADGNPLWISQATAISTSATDTIPNTEWAAAAILAQDGTSGQNVARPLIYQRGTSAPTLPSATATYTFATGVLTGLNNGWTSAIPAADGNPLYVSGASAASAGTTDTIASGEWATPVILIGSGVAGEDGLDGLNQATVTIYRRSATSPALPSATATYTFATGAITGLNNSWTKTIPPADGNPLWVSQATAISTGSTDTIATGEWAAVQILAQDGAPGLNGLNTARPVIYRRNATTPTLPTATTTYTFATGALTGLDNGWTLAIPASNGNPLYASAASAASTGATDTIGSSEWAAPVAILLDGAGGASGLNQATARIFRRAATAPALPSVTTTYTFATGALTSLNNSWTTTVPAADGNPLWTSQATAISTATFDTIAASEWAAVSILAQDGSDGVTVESTGPTAYAVPCFGDGTPKPSALSAASGTIRLSKSSGVITTGVTGFMVISQTGVEATINGTTGVYSFTSILSDKATCVFGCSYDGRIYQITISLNKVLDGKAATEEIDTANISGMTTTSYPSSDNEQADIDIVLPTGKTLTIDGLFNYYATDQGSFSGKIKITYQNISGGGSETDLFSDSGDLAVTFVQFFDYNGDGIADDSAVTYGYASASGSTTLTNSTGVSLLYRIRIYAAKLSGSQPGIGQVSIRAGY